MLTDRNQLPPPQAIERPDFEALFVQFKTDYVANLRTLDANLADQVEETLSSDAELISKMFQNFALWLINHIERTNEQVRQQLPSYAKDSNLDHVVSLQAIERQVIEPGDPDAYPPVPKVMESDDSVLTRFWLAPHAPAAGSRMGYRFHALTLDERPAIKLEKVGQHQVVVTYTLPDASNAAQIKDAQARKISEGNVKLVTLAHAGNGEPSADLLSAVTAYFQREDVKPETDNLHIAGAIAVDYILDVVVDVADGPDLSLLRSEMETALADYANEARRLAGVVQRSRIDQILHNAGAKNIQINSPASDVTTTYTHAPHCTAINLTLRVFDEYGIPVTG